MYITCLFYWIHIVQLYNYASVCMRDHAKYTVYVVRMFGCVCVCRLLYCSRINKVQV